MHSEDFYISTYIIDKAAGPAIKLELKNQNTLLIKNLSFKQQENELAILKKIILNAKRNQDDAILITKSSSFHKYYSPGDILNSILDLYNEKLNVLILDGHIKSPVIFIKNNLYFVNKVERLKTFVLLKDSFNFIINVINSFDEGDTDGTVEQIINLYNLQKACGDGIAKINREQEVLLKKSFIDKNKNRINIIVPFWNVSGYIGECCRSIIEQSHKNWRAFFVDDLSTDNSSELIPKHENFTVKKNTSRKYTLENIHDIIIGHDFAPDDIIVILDGDDAFLNDYALDIINTIYSDENITVSYGSYTTSKNYSDLGEMYYTEEEFKNLRDASWKASHLKSFKFKAYLKLIEQDPTFLAFKDNNNNFYKMTSDIALMFPLLEISGYERTFANLTPIYFYRLHENNDHYINRQLQYDIEMEIRKKTPLKPVISFN